MRLAKGHLAQMAESVDALVSNTSGVIRAGSTPALGTQKNLQMVYNQSFGGFILCLASSICPHYRIMLDFLRTNQCNCGQSG